MKDQVKGLVGCQPEGERQGEEKRAHYRKLRIGAGHRIYAAGALGGDCGGAPTAQSCSVELGQILLVALQVPSARSPRHCVAGNSGRLLREKDKPGRGESCGNWRLP